MATEPVELWRWQEGTAGEDNLYGTTVAGDGSVVVTGRTDGDWDAPTAGDFDFMAAKFDADGTEQWRWQAGTQGEDVINDATTTSDGFIVLAGNTAGDWSGTNAGARDFAAVKLAPDGSESWRWQDGTLADDVMVGITASPGIDGSVVLAGRTEGDWRSANAGAADFVVVKLARDGGEEWRWQEGTIREDTTKSIVAGSDGSIVISGYTEGDLSGTNAGETDFVAVKLDPDGNVLWRWQGGTDAFDYFSPIAVAEDGSVVLAGYSTGDWGATNAGEEDFAAVKLDEDGLEMWRWQEGTPLRDKLFAAAVTEDGSIILAGYSEGDWGGVNAGGSDMAAVKLSPDGAVLWRWQEGTTESDWVTAAAAGSRGGSVVLAGTSEGAWSPQGSSGGVEDFAAIVLDVAIDVVIATPAPAVSSAVGSMTGSSTHESRAYDEDQATSWLIVEGVTPAPTAATLSGSDADSSSATMNIPTMPSTASPVFMAETPTPVSSINSPVMPSTPVPDFPAETPTPVSVDLPTPTTSAETPHDNAISSPAPAEKNSVNHTPPPTPEINPTGSSSSLDAISAAPGASSSSTSAPFAVATSAPSVLSQEITEFPTMAPSSAPFALAPRLSEATRAPVTDESGGPTVLTPEASGISGGFVISPPGGGRGEALFFLVGVCLAPRVLTSVLLRRHFLDRTR